ncbi:prohead protease/major capsid protein fusion protein [Undibacterium sp. CY21W]|uniref:prohead protease/major capsid protein fusion protein n=1 Tax=Undibacterium sp. CY21W TaxID=2762293 RepID=UPI00164BF508|nr:prohead protease/major capsid protein fusion protein [Undibacterium sp. CY21W]MBC3927780.1 peptidase U35 [Undibacterium sp. CY21W]
MPNISKAITREQVHVSLRAAPITTSNETDRTINVTWTAGAGVRRYDYMRERYYQEQLSQEASAVRMETLQSGKAPFLNTHSSWSLGDVIGVIESASSPADGGAAVIRFSKRAEVEPIFQDVKDKILNSVSLGAKIHRMEMIAPDVEGNKDWIYRAIDWEPYEISLVPIGADPGAVVRSADGKIVEQPKPPMFECEVITITRSITPTDNASAASTTTQKGNSMPQSIEELKRAVIEAEAALKTARAAQQGTSVPTVVTETEQTTARTNATNDAATIERNRIKDIREAVRASTLPGKEALIDGYTDRGLSVDAVRADVLRRMAEASEANAVRGQGGHRVETVTDETEVRREAMMVSVMHRIAPSAVKLTDAARVYRGLSLRELCREALEAGGISTRGMSQMELASAALGMSQRGFHNTTDLPLIFGNVISRTMRQAYAGAPKTFTSWATPGTLSDFRPVTRASFDAAVQFDKIGQSGEYKYGSLQDGGETIQLATYGKAVNFTRQMIINDDLSALQRLPQFFGRAAADMESDIVYSILMNNPKMSDGVDLFHVDRGNIADTAAKISVDSLSAGRAALRVRKSPGGSVLNLAPKILLVPAALETLALQYTSNAYTPTKSTDQNIFQNVLTPVIEPRLDAASIKAWWLIADKSQIDTVEFAYLDGEEGIFTEQNTDFDRDGIQVKGRIDFAAKAIDWRGMHVNMGA